MAQPEYYEVEVAGLTRRLQLFTVASGIRIALFEMLGDTGLVKAIALELAKRLPAEIDLIVTTGLNCVPLAYELSAQTGFPYLVLRKNRKPFMRRPLRQEVLTITTAELQTLWLDGRDRPKVKGKRVLLLEDVISTGSSIEGLEKVVRRAGGEVVARAAVFTEGDPERWQDVIALGHLPVFVNDRKK
jgi:adenine/guanine phosphoribosyltransferase-like PRPP-binding protein